MPHRLCVFVLFLKRGSRSNWSPIRLVRDSVMVLEKRFCVSASGKVPRSCRENAGSFPFRHNSRRTRFAARFTFQLRI